MKSLFLSIEVVFILMIFQNLVFAGEFDRVHVGGAYLGVLNSLHQQDTDDRDDKRSQFDFAANLDVGWQIHKRIRGTLQLQMGSGEGSLGFVGTSATLTDMNVTVDLNSNFELTFGSFDTPFGGDVPYLTNNGDASANPLILNSLFYSAFAGTNVGTLNTLGIKGVIGSKYGSVNVALTNGTDEIAANPDGNFEYVVMLETAPVLSGLRAAGSFIYSDDNTSSGVSGTESEFWGWLLDAIYETEYGHFLKAYYGMIEYGDKDNSTKDEVGVYKVEGNVGMDHLFISARISVWEPEDSNADSLGISEFVPHPGYAKTLGMQNLPNDLSIIRYQLVTGYRMTDDLIIKIEGFLDNYRKKVNNISFDTYGLILGINVLF